MESGQQKRRRKKHRSSNHSSLSNSTTFHRFASCTPLKLDDVKTRGKKMAKTATRTHHQTSTHLVSGHVSKSRSLRVLSADRASTGQGLAVRPARGSALSPAKLPKKVDYKSPNVKELTKELVNKAKRPKVRLNNANHPVRRGKPKTSDGIFQQGRQRPTGPVRTFIVFKASSKHNQVRRRKPKRGLKSRLPGERRFSAVPVYNPRFYKKSELKGRKLSKLRLSEKINVQLPKGDVDGGLPITHQSGATTKVNSATADSATSHHFAALASVDAKQGGAKKVAPRAPAAGSKGATKLTSEAVGTAFEKVHVGRGSQAKPKPKKKRLSVSVLQKKPVGRRSCIYKQAKGKVTKRRTQSKSRQAKKPAKLTLSRKSLLAIIRPGFEMTLKKRIANMQRMKRLERDEC